MIEMANPTPIQRINELEERRIKLDKKDIRIISVLLRNSRTPYTEMAKGVMLSKDAVKYRISKLQQEGLILGFYPQVDYSMLGYEEFVIKLLLDESEKENQAKLFDALIAHPNVTRVVEFSDRWDVEVTVLARNIKEFDKIDVELSKDFNNVIRQKEKNPVVKKYLRDCCPPEFNLDRSYIEQLKGMPYLDKPHVKVDAKDRQILKYLAKNCRSSTYELQQHVKLSADAIGLRVKRMLKSGLIEKFTIALNYSLLNYHLYSFEADLCSLDSKSEKNLVDFAVTHPYIQSAKKTLGYLDVVIDIMCRSPKHLHITIEGLKKHFSTVIRDYETLIAFHEHYFNPFPDALIEAQQSLKG